MTSLDMERYRRERLGVTTDAERDARVERIVRYRPDDEATAVEADTLWFPPGQQVGNLTDAQSITAGQTRALYLGRAGAAYATITARLRVTTAHSTVTWAEIGIAVGTPKLGSGADLTLLGYMSVISDWGTTGIKSHAIAIADGASGDELWFLYGADASVQPVFRVALGDELLSGRLLFASSTRPSTMAVNTAFSVPGSTATAGIWLTLSGS